MKGRAIPDFERKPVTCTVAARRELQRQPNGGRLVKLAMPKPPTAKLPRPAPDVQIARGPLSSKEYPTIRRAFKRRTSVQYQARWYRVASLRVNDVGNFEAKLVEVV